MSRIGRMPIEKPKGVEIKIDDQNNVTVKGPKGTLTRTFSRDLKIVEEDGKIIVTRPSDKKIHRALHGLTRTLINNMIIGVTQGYQKSLDIVGVGYRASKQGKKLVMSLGYSHQVEMEEPEGITFEVPAQNKIIVKGIDKQQVGEIAAKIRFKRPPEVYKGKGIRYENEVVKLKEGKAGAKGKK